MTIARLIQSRHTFLSIPDIVKFLLVGAFALVSRSSHAQEYLVTIDSLEQRLETTQDYDARLELISNCLEATIFNDLEKAYEYVLWFEKEAMASGDSSEIARSKNFFGIHAGTAGDYYRAISEYEDALEYYIPLKDTMMVGMMFNNIGAAYEFQAERENSILYFRKAYDEFKSIGQEQWAFYIKFNIAEQYYEQNRLLEAEPIYLEALDYFKKSGDENELIQVQVRLAKINYLLAGASEAAELIDNISMDVAITEKSTRVLYEVTYCEILTDLERLTEAQSHCEAAVKVAEEFGAQREMAMAFGASYRFLKTKGEYQEALHVHERLMTLNDSVVNAMRDKQMVNLLTKYEIREKEKELGVKDLQLAQREQEADYFRLVFVLVGAVLLGAIIFVISRIKTNQKLRKQKEIVQKSLNDRELLLREIHHRVKNNLQVISSILSIQSRDIDDDTALSAINEARSRVKSMALIHQDLYGEDNLRGIKAQAYITKLSNSLFSTYRIDKDRVKLSTDIEDLLLDVDTTVPLGLILNELVTNSLKYAFPNNQEGEIYVGLQEEGGVLRLTVRDTGVGIPAEKEKANKESFGMKMIRAFSKKLDATWEVDGSNGTSISMFIKNYRLA